MINIIFYFISLISTTSILTHFYLVIPLDGRVAISVLFCAIFILWGVVTISNIAEIRKEHWTNYHSIKKLLADKESYKREMVEYIKEMRPELLDKYKEFEECLMQSIRDSKIIATMLEKSSYAEVLKSYDHKIANFLESINNTDRNIQEIVLEMKVQKEDKLFGYALFIPNLSVGDYE